MTNKSTLCNFVVTSGDVSLTTAGCSVVSGGGSRLALTTQHCPELRAPVIVILHGLGRQGSPLQENLFLFFTPHKVGREQETLIHTYFPAYHALQEWHVGPEAAAPASESTHPQTPQLLNFISFLIVFSPLLG